MNFLRECKNIISYKLYEKRNEGETTSGGRKLLGCKSVLKLNGIRYPVCSVSIFQYYSIIIDVELCYLMHVFDTERLNGEFIFKNFGGGRI